MGWKQIPQEAEDQEADVRSLVWAMESRLAHRKQERGHCDQVLCIACWGMVHGKGTLISHQQLPAFGRAAYLEEQKVMEESAGKGGPLAALADFDARKAAAWVAQIVACWAQFDQARRAGLGISISSISGTAARASVETTRYTSIQAQAPQSHAEQLQKVCGESGSAAYTDVCIKAYVANRQADVNSIAHVLDTVSKKSSANADKRNESLSDKVVEYETAIKGAIAKECEVALGRDAKGQGLARMEVTIAKVRTQLEALQVRIWTQMCGFCGGLHAF
jgi:hypothetical protein